MVRGSGEAARRRPRGGGRAQDGRSGRRRSGRPQILVNNGGGGGHVEPHYPDAGPAQWGATLDLNLRGAMLATQLSLEPMGRNGGGAVVNIASTAGLGFRPYESPSTALPRRG